MPLSNINLNPWLLNRNSSQGANTAPARFDDPWIRRVIEKDMARFKELSGVRVSVNGGVVTLTGSVRGERWAGKARAISEEVKGVKAVRSLIKY